MPVKVRRLALHLYLTAVLLNLATLTEVKCSPQNNTGVPVKSRNFSAESNANPPNWSLTRIIALYILSVLWMLVLLT